jgi:tetratricopeptide (TPR) repeat protein
MLRTLNILPFLLTASAFAEALPGPHSWLSVRQMTLTFQAGSATQIDRVKVWTSNDGKTWTEAHVTKVTRNSVRYDAPKDGNYRFYVILENKAGRSADPPSGASNPHLIVTVDTAPPTVQIHSAQETVSPHGERLLHLNASVLEENLDEAGCRIFHRANAHAGWQDGGPVAFADGLITWQLPPDIGLDFDLRLVVTDLAGNRAFDEIRDVSIAPFPTDPRPTPLHPAPTVAVAGQLDVLPEVVVPSVPPVTLAPVLQCTLADEPLPAATAASSQAETQSQHLREQAARYLAQGRPSLASARFQDALELAPDDPDLQVDLASLLYRTRQYDQAQQRFQLALDSSPEHLGAIEGLALVAVTQNRYPQARSYLEQLLQICPESGIHWLRYGDIEHKLGNAAQAHAAWEKALKLEPADETVREMAQKRLRLFRQSPATAK